MTKLRVAHIITQMELGGAQRNTLYTVMHLDSARFEPFLMSGPGGLLDEEARSSGVFYFVIRDLVRPVRPFKDIRAFIDIYRHLRHLRPDIVHTHSSKAGILGRVAAYLAGVPVILHTYHGFGFTPEQRGFVRRGFVGVEKFCGWLSTHLVFVSSTNRAEARQRGIGLRTPNSLIRSGIPIHLETHAGTHYRGQEKRKPGRAMREKLKIPENAWVVITVGNFKPQKNMLDAARVAERVLLLAPDIHFLLVGDGDERETVKRFVDERSLGDRVHLLGWLKRRDDVRNAMHWSRCFLLTSLWEGLPRALVEAFAAKLPAVCYAVDGVSDILKDGETGFEVPPRDIERAAEKVLWLKAHPEEAREMGRQGWERVRDEFDIDRMVRQQEGLYDKLFAEVPLKEYYKLPAS